MDNNHQKLPHIHAKYQEKETVVALPDGEILEGDLPGNKMKLLQAWIELHKDELRLTGGWLYPVSSRTRLNLCGEYSESSCKQDS